MFVQKKISTGFEGEKIIDIPKEVLTHCSMLPLVRLLFISRIGIYPNAKNHYYKRNAGLSKSVILLHCIDGEGWIKISKKIFILKAGEAFFIPANVAHSYGASFNKPWSISWMHIDGTKNNELIAASYSESILSPLKVVFSEERAQLFNQIFDVLSNGFSISNLSYANFILPHYIGTIISSAKLNNFSTEIVSEMTGTNAAIKFMQRNISNPISIEGISKYLGMSSSFFFKKFKKETGYSPIAYFNFLKIQKACQLFHSESLSIAEVGSRIGINDPYYFSRLFKKQMGVSPRRYKNNLLEN